MGQPIPFIDYWDAIDAEMLSLYGIDTWDAGLEPEQIADAQEAGAIATDIVRWFGESCGLTSRHKAE